MGQCERDHTLTWNALDFLFFFFQAEDGIRDWSVTGVQTCALPIYVVVEWIGRSQKNGQDCALIRYQALLNPLEIDNGGMTLRSEERRVGKEGRSRWSPYH